MPIDLGPRFGPSYTGIPAHISPHDLTLWYRYWPRLRATTTAIYFDVALGGAAPVPPGTSTADAALWTRLTSKRADVIADTGSGWTIIELRHAANPNAVGRLLAYAMLWRADPPDNRPLTLTLISDTTDNTTAQLAAAHGISYTVLPG